MQVELLGTGGYHPTAERHTACVLLPELGLVFDAGSAFFRLSKRLRTDSICILLSHVHLDHIMGLTNFFSLQAEQSIKHMEVHAEAEKLQAIQEHLFHAAIFPAPAPYVWKPLTPQPILWRDARITWFPLSHPGGSCGYRVEVQNKVLVYVTDTTAGLGLDYTPYLQNCDLLIHECNFPDSQAELAQRTGHSCLTPVITLAKQANVKQLVLTHFDPVERLLPEHLSQARQIFPQFSLAADSAIYEF
jgi:ribonuclease Z